MDVNILYTKAMDVNLSRCGNITYLSSLKVTIAGKTFHFFSFLYFFLFFVVFRNHTSFVLISSIKSFWCRYNEDCLVLAPLFFFVYKKNIVSFLTTCFRRNTFALFFFLKKVSSVFGERRRECGSGPELLKNHFGNDFLIFLVGLKHLEIEIPLVYFET